MSGRVSSPTFIGRAEELRLLETARVRAANAEPAVVLLGGEAGVGKTLWGTERHSCSSPVLAQETTE